MDNKKSDSKKLSHDFGTIFVVRRVETFDNGAEDLSICGYYHTMAEAVEAVVDNHDIPLSDIDMHEAGMTEVSFTGSDETGRKSLADAIIREQLIQHGKTFTKTKDDFHIDEYSFGEWY